MDQTKSAVFIRQHLWYSCVRNKNQSRSEAIRSLACDQHVGVLSGSTNAAADDSKGLTNENGLSSTKDIAEWPS